MRARFLPAFLLLLPGLGAQNLLPDGDFQAGPTTWTMTQFNDPAGTTGIADARVLAEGPSAAVFADFQTLTSVRSATWRSQPFPLAAGTYPVGFAAMWEKQVTTPIPYPSVNRVDLRLFDSTNTMVYETQFYSPNQTALIERATFAGTVTLANTDTYTAELFLRHSNLAGLPYTTRVDDVFVGSADSWFFGRGCAGSGGFVPVVGVQGAARVNSNTFALTANDTYGPTLAFFMMDVSNTSAGGLPLPYALGGGCDLNVGLTVFLPAGVAASGNGVGVAAQPLPIPNNQGLAGVVLFAQWAVSDPAGANPFSAVTTRGFGFRIR